MIKYIKGDIFAPFERGEYNVLMHGCNCFCQMGAGIAKTIKHKYPEVYRRDCKTARGSKRKLGTIDIISVGDEKVVVNAYTQYDYRGKGVNAYTQYDYRGKGVNAYTQYDYRGKGVNADYKAIESCFKTLYDFAKTNSYKVCIPKIGAGLAGGDWNVIEQIINKVFKEYPIDVYYL